MLLHLFMHSLVESCVCSDQGWNPQTLVYQDDAPTNLATQPGHDISIYISFVGVVRLKDLLFLIGFYIKVSSSDF